MIIYEVLIGVNVMYIQLRMLEFQLSIQGLTFVFLENNVD